MMRAVQATAFGDPGTVLELAKTSTPEPSPGSAVVRMLARPINPNDVAAIRGSYPFDWVTAATLPATPGGEGLGVVADPGDTGLITGSRVAVYYKLACPITFGTWAEYTLARPAGVVAVPDGVDDATAAQLWQNPLSAWGVLHQCGVGMDQTLVVAGATSATGRVLVQLAHQAGVRVLAVVHRAETAGEIAALGADVVHTGAVGLTDAILDMTDGAGADALADAVAGPVGSAAAAALGPDAPVVAYGRMSGAPSDPGGHPVTNFFMTGWREQIGDQVARAALQELTDRFADGRLTPLPVAAEYDLADVRTAITRTDDGSPRRGKVLLTG